MVDVVIVDATSVEPFSVEKLVKEKPGTFRVDAVIVDAVNMFVNSVDPCIVE